MQRYITARCAAVSNATVAKELNVLKHLLRLSVEEWEYIPTNPSHGIKPPKPAAGRVRYLQPGELRMVLEAAPSWLRPIIAIAVATGMRRSEILGSAGWTLISTAGVCCFRIPRMGKVESSISTGWRSRRLSRCLSPKDEPSGLLFPKLQPEWVSVAFSRLCHGLKIENFHFHDLRHTAASWLRMNGADIHTVAQLLGHKDLRMAARYQHLSPNFLADAVGRLDTAFAECHHMSPARKRFRLELR